MPNWTDTPTPRRGPRPLPIMRTPVGKPLVATITTDRMSCCPTHFWGGRTTPCEKPDCDACNHGSPSREHAYLGIYFIDQQASAILELPDGAAEQLALLAKNLPTLRGARIRVTRTKLSRNARVCVELAPPAINPPPLPTPPQLREILAIIWKLPQAAITEEKADMRQNTIRLDAIIMAKRNGKPTPSATPNVQP